MKGQEEARPSFLKPLPSQLFFFFWTGLFWWSGWFQSVGLWGGLSGSKPLPEEARPGQNPPDAWLQVRGAGKGNRKGEASGSEKAGRRRPRCAARRRRGKRPGPRQPLPGRLQVESAEAADSAAPGAAPPPFPPRGRLPSPEGAGLGAPGARPPSRGCASAPRRWLRAGGGRTRRKSCATVASSGARAAPGAVRSRATLLQVRGSGSARRCAGPRAGRPGAAQVLLRKVAAFTRPVGTGTSWRREGEWVFHPHPHFRAEPEDIHTGLYKPGPGPRSRNCQFSVHAKCRSCWLGTCGPGDLLISG